MGWRDAQAVLVDILEGLDIGVVSGDLRYVENFDDYHDKFLNPEDFLIDEVKAWTVNRDSVRVDRQDSSLCRDYVIHNFMIRGYYGINIDVENRMQDAVDLILDALEPKRNFASPILDGGPPNVENMAEVSILGYRVQSVTISFPVLEERSLVIT